MTVLLLLLSTVAVMVADGLSDSHVRSVPNEANVRLFGLNAGVDGVAGGKADGRVKGNIGFDASGSAGGAAGAHAGIGRKPFG